MWRARISRRTTARAARIRGAGCVRPTSTNIAAGRMPSDGRIRLVTLAPEWPQAPRYIEAIVAEGVVASIGHTNAGAQQIADAVSAGATLSTHLGNGAHQVLRRHPNYIWDQLAEDRLMADFIVDGIHLAASFLKVAVRAKGLERSVLVTDAAGPAGAKPGRYRLGEQDVDLTTRRPRRAGRSGQAGRQRAAHGSRRREPDEAGRHLTSGSGADGIDERGAAPAR